MSNKRDRRRERPGPHHHDENTVWVSSECDPVTGVYVCTVQRGDHVLRSLPRTEALAYADAFTRHVANARYDATVVQQLRGIGVDDMQAVGMVVRDLRAERPSPNPLATHPITIEPMVSQRDLIARLKLTDGTGSEWQWDTEDALRHVMHVLEVSAGVDMDALYLRLLRSSIGLDEGTARGMVTRLGDYYQHDD